MPVFIKIDKLIIAIDEIKEIGIKTIPELLPPHERQKPETTLMKMAYILWVKNKDKEIKNIVRSDDPRTIICAFNSIAETIGAKTIIDIKFKYDE